MGELADVVSHQLRRVRPTTTTTATTTFVTIITAIIITVIIINAIAVAWPISLMKPIEGQLRKQLLLQAQRQRPVDR